MKTDLHCHLDGSLRMSTLIELAKAQGVQLPAETESGIKRAMGLGQEHENLESYLGMFDLTIAVMQTKEAIRRVAYELVEDGAREGLSHLEIRFSPVILTNKGLFVEEALEAALDGMKEATDHLPITAIAILCGLRHHDPKQNLEVAKLAARYKHQGVTGFDLAGPELGHGAREHKEAFGYAKDHGLNLTVHAGEGDGPESIRQAIFDCHAQRIGHGTRLLEDEALFEHVVEKGIAIEACISSNLHTGVIKELAAHPAKKMLDKGAIVTINTDNRLMSQTTVTAELRIAQHELGLTENDIARLMSNGVRASFQNLAF